MTIPRRLPMRLTIGIPFGLAVGAGAALRGTGSRFLAWAFGIRGGRVAWRLGMGEMMDRIEETLSYRLGAMARRDFWDTAVE